MARDPEQERRDNLNRGIPKKSGLDDDTRANLERAAADKSGGTIVGSFRDLQMGLTAEPLEDRPLNPNQDPDGLITAPEAEAEQFGDSAAGDSSADDFDSMTVEELQDELRAQDKPVSGSKDELIARLEGKE